MNKKEEVSEDEEEGKSEGEEPATMFEFVKDKVKGAYPTVQS